MYGDFDLKTKRQKYEKINLIFEEYRTLQELGNNKNQSI